MESENNFLQNENEIKSPLKVVNPINGLLESALSYITSEAVCP